MDRVTFTLAVEGPDGSKDLAEIEVGTLRRCQMDSWCYLNSPVVLAQAQLSRGGWGRNNPFDITARRRWLQHLRSARFRFCTVAIVRDEAKDQESIDAFDFPKLLRTCELKCECRNGPK